MQMPDPQKNKLKEVNDKLQEIVKVIES